MAGLKEYLIRRLITFIPTIIGVTIIVFLIANVIPADPARAWAGGERARPEVIERIRKMYHLDDPWYIQYIFVMKGILNYFINPNHEGALIDPLTSRYVFDDIFLRFPTTLQLAIFAEIFILSIGIPLGLISALKKDTLLDTFVRIFALIGVSLPIFWIGYIFIWIFFTNLGWTTLAGVPVPKCYETGTCPITTHIPLFDAIFAGEFDTLMQIIKRFWLPGFTLGLGYAGILARIVRNSFLDALNSDFIEFAKAKGLPKRWIWKHALKNAMVPIITVIGLQFGGLLGGAYITETVFGLPGVGRYAVQAISNLDMPAVIGTTLLFSFLYVTVNLIVDITYSIIDPRVRY